MTVVEFGAMVSRPATITARPEGGRMVVRTLDFVWNLSREDAYDLGEAIRWRNGAEVAAIKVEDRGGEIAFVMSGGTEVQMLTEDALALANFLEGVV